MKVGDKVEAQVAHDSPTVSKNTVLFGVGARGIVEDVGDTITIRFQNKRQYTGMAERVQEYFKVVDDNS